MNSGINLIGHNKVFTNLINLYKDQKLPNKILLSGNKGIGKFLFASHFTNYVLSENEEFKYNEYKFLINKNNKSYILFNNNSHPNIHIVSKKNGKKNIDISQIREMIQFQNNSSFNSKIRFILIDSVDSLNLSSINALLKSLEEPNENVIYILTHNIESKILDTVKSRCINFKMFLDSPSVKSIVNNCYSENIYDSIAKDFINYYNNPSFIISLINYINDNSLDISNLTIENLIYLFIENKDYTKNNFIKNNIKLFIEMFFYKKIYLSRNNLFRIKEYFCFKLNQIQTYNLDSETFFLEFKHKLLSE